MSLALASVSGYRLVQSHSLPVKVNTVCAMSVYSNDRLEWLAQAVESVLFQSLPADLFVIVIDGEVASDLSQYLINIEQRYENVVLAFGSENRGLSSCMNFVVETVRPLKPEYFIRMDADDICVAHRFEKQIGLLEKHADVAVLGSALIEINEQGRVVGARRLPLTHTKLLASFCRRCPINHPTVILRYSIFENGHSYAVDRLNTQDYFLWIALAADGYKFANVKEPLLKFRRIDGFYKRRGRGKSMNEFKARLLAMDLLSQKTVQNYSYALFVLALRMMPAPIVKLAYKLDRSILKRRS